MAVQTPLAPFIGTKTARILIVDDEPVNLKVLAAHLTRWGCEVRTAQSGPEALAAMASFRPDLVLLDILMPGQSGFEVCQALHQDPATRHIPVIFLTALAASDAKIQGLDAGARDYITKPFMAPELAARVGAALRSKFDEDALRERMSTLARRAAADGLTGLVNRTAFEDEALAVLRDGAPSRWPLSLALFDLDRFGRYNATFGHGRGDEALRQTGEVIRAHARTGTVARYDKDCFAWLLPSTPQAVAAGLADAIRRRASQPDLTLSAGGTTLIARPAGSPETVLDALFAAAGVALERSKQAGGNRVTWG